jgi:hypothetical protein
MERLLIGLLVLGFMSATIVLAARLAVGRPSSSEHEQRPTQLEMVTRTGAEQGELPGLADSALPSALD